jgi:transcriptional regulator with XRE-family HTH domain
MKIARRQTYSSGLAGIRKRLGLSQQQLADQLNVNRSTIKFAEQGKRSLPTSALLQVAQLEIMLSKEPEKPIYERLHPAETMIISKCRRSYELMFSKESTSRLNSIKLRSKLQVMSGLYNKNREWLNIVEKYLKENRKNGVTNEWWKKQQQSAVRTLNKCGLPLQAILKSKIALLDAESELYRNMKEQLKSDLPDFFKEKV